MLDVDVVRPCWFLLGLLGCGRIAFDPSALDDARGSSTDADLPALACAETSLPIAAVSADMDLVVTALDGGGFAAAWLEIGPQTYPFIARFDAAWQLIAGPVELNAHSTGVGTIVDLGTVIYLSTEVDSIQNHYSFDHQLGAPQYVVTIAGFAGHDCITADEPRTRYASASRFTTMVDLSYITVAGTGMGDQYDNGVVLRNLGCSGGSDHTHVAWSDADGTCKGAKLTFVSPLVPTVADVMTFSTDCRDVRIASVSSATDTGAVVWSTASGVVETVVVDGVAGPTRQISPSGRSPRVQSDGSRIWFAWLDTRSGVDELRIGHLLPNGTLTDAVVGSLPAGDAAFELVRSGSTVYLVVLSTSGLRVMQLCA